MSNDESHDVDDSFALRLAQLHDRVRTDGVVVPHAQQVEDDSDVRQALDALLLIQQVKQDQLDSRERLKSLQETQGPVDTAVEQRRRADQRLNIEKQRVGRFELVELIGKGGYGMVYRARDLEVGRDVALKIPRVQIIASAELETRFIREAKAAGALSHPNIVTVYEAGRDQEVFYIASELIEGPTLAQWLVKSDALPGAKQIAKLISTLADAMQHAHSRGVLHRDLKPSNILLEMEKGSGTFCRNGPKGASHKSDVTPFQALDRPRIADFGLAKFEREQADATQTGMIVGTPAYMAPEQTAGTRGVGAAADIYSLGAVMYELVTGRKPFVGTTILAMIKAVKEEPPIVPRRLRADVPRDLEAICLKCLEKEPNARYTTAGELEADLQRFLNGETVIARPITNADRAVRWIRRNPLLSGALGAAVFFLLSALAATTIGWISTNNLLVREGAALSEAEKRYHDMKRAVDTYFTKVAANSALKNTPGTEALRNELLALALGHYQQFVAENKNDPELISEIAETEFQMGEILRELSRFREARESYQSAAHKVARQLELEPDDLAARMLEAEVTNRLGSVNLSIGELENAATFLRRAIELQQELFDEDRGDHNRLQRLARYTGQLGQVLRNDGQLTEWVDQMTAAQTLFDMALQLDDSSPDFRLAAIQNLGGLGKAYRATGKAEQSEKIATQMADELKTIVESEVNFWDAHELYVTTIIDKSTFAIMRRDFAGPLPDLEHARAIVDRLCSLHPALQKYAGIRQGILKRLAIAADRSGDKKLADKTFHDLVLIARNQLARSDSVIEAKFNLAQHLANLVMFRLGNRRSLEDAPALISEADQLSQDCRNAQPDNYEFKLLRVMILDVASQLAYGDKNYEETLEFVDEAAAMIDELKSSGANDPKVNHHAWIIYQYRARASKRMDRHQDSVDSWSKVIEYCPPPERMKAQLRLAAAHMRLDQFKESAEIFASASPHLARREDFLFLARYYGLAATQKDIDEQTRQSLLDKAIEALHELRESGYLNATWKVDIVAENEDLKSLHGDSRFKDLVKAMKRDLEKPD